MDLRYIHSLFRLIEDWNLRFPHHVKINGWDIVELSHSLLHSSCKDLPDSLFVLELDFRLGRMDVYINILCVHIKIDKIRHLLTCGYQPFKRILYRFVEIWMFHITPIHKEILMCSLFSGRLRFSHKAIKTTYCCIHFHGQQFLINFLAEYVYNALSQGTRSEIKQLGMVTVKGKAYMWINQYDSLEGDEDIIQFCGI